MGVDWAGTTREEERPLGARRTIGGIEVFNHALPPFHLRTAAETGVTGRQVAEALMILLPILNLGSLGVSQIDVVSLHSSAG